MSEPRCYEEVVRCLEMEGYDVSPYPPGYMVRHRSDPTDVSLVRNLAELVELAELFEWAAQRQGHTATK